MEQARHMHARGVLEALLGVPFTTGNAVDVMRDGNEVFPALLQDIGGATRSVDLLWFLWGKGQITREVAGALSDRARHGVRVRVLLDGFGAKGIDRELLRAMRSAGCCVRFYRPLRTWRLTSVNKRTHRRVLVCDGQVGITGGTGIDQAWTGDGLDPGSWRDSALRLRGPAVAGLRGAFNAAWAESGHPRTGVDDLPVLEAVGRSPVQVLRPASTPGWNDAMLALEALFHLARTRVRVTTPYSRLPRPLLETVAATRRRAVQVQLLVPGPHVDRPVVHLQGERGYAALLEAGVEIWRYGPSMLHNKCVTVDGALAMVGTTNLDSRSLALNEQVALLVADPDVVATLDRHIDEDLSLSAPLDAGEWARRGTRARLLENASAVAGLPLRGLGARGLAGRTP